MEGLLILDAAVASLSYWSTLETLAELANQLVDDNEMAATWTWRILAMVLDPEQDNPGIKDLVPHGVLSQVEKFLLAYRMSKISDDAVIYVYSVINNLVVHDAARTDDNQPRHFNSVLKAVIRVIEGLETSDKVEDASAELCMDVCAIIKLDREIWSAVDRWLDSEDRRTQALVIMANSLPISECSK